MVRDDLSRIALTLENRSGGAHETGLTLQGLPAGEYVVTVDGRRIGRVAGGATASTIPLPLTASTVAVAIERDGPR